MLFPHGFTSVFALFALSVVSGVKSKPLAPTLNTLNVGSVRPTTAGLVRRRNEVVGVARLPAIGFASGQHDAVYA